MRFQVTSKGRTLFLEASEKFCKGCGKQETKNKRWYYYDEPISKGLYCRDCAQYFGGFVREAENKIYQFWEIDAFRYGGEDDDKTILDD